MGLRSIRPWPKKLLSQTIVLVLLALLLAQLISLWILSNAHRRVFESFNQGVLSRQLSTIVNFMESSPVEVQNSIIASWQRPWMDFKLLDRSALGGPHNAVELQVARQLEHRLGAYSTGLVRVQLGGEHGSGDFAGGQLPATGKPTATGRFALHNHPFWRRANALNNLQIEIPLRDGRWLQAKMALPRFAPLMAIPTLVFVVVSSVLVLLALVWRLKKITLPLAQLSDAANALGRGHAVEPIPEQGPEDIKNAVSAFNQMNGRLQRFVAERTHMLAALSHDLRSPITSMRLQLEMMPAGSERDQLLASLDEMLQMAAGTLDFIRRGDGLEPTRDVDVAALLASICDDLADMGADVKFELSSAHVLPCRLLSLKRALRNLILNAVNYGAAAEVSLQRCDAATVISIQDRGPGIADELLEKVFEPFFRVETSRSRDTGGIGLGLSIARQIISGHGGEIQLRNTAKGLLVRVYLPLNADPISACLTQM